MSVPYTLYNELRLYDRAVADFVGSLPVDYGELSGIPQRATGILWVYSTPEKAMSTMADILRRKGWSQKGVVGVAGKESSDWLNVPLPFASIHREDPIPDPMRGTIPFIFDKFIRRGRSFGITRYPAAYDIQYTVDYWVKKTFTKAYIIEWLAVQKSPIGAGPNELFLTVPFGAPWGPKLITLKDFSIADNSDLEPGDEEDRKLRFTLSFQLKAWFFYTVSMPPAEGSSSGGGGSSSTFGQAAPSPIQMRAAIDVGLMSVQDPEGTTPISPTRLQRFDYDIVGKLLQNDPVFIEMGAMVKEVDTNKYTVPSTTFIQTVDVPILSDELILSQPSLKLTTALPDGLVIEVLDSNDVVMQMILTGEGETDISPQIYTTTDYGVTSLRFRFNPTDDAEIEFVSETVRMLTSGLMNAANLLPSGDMESGLPSDWLPVIGSDTQQPDSCDFSTQEHFEGARSLKVETNGKLQGSERTLIVSPRKTYLVTIRLKSQGGVIEFNVVDDAPGGAFTYEYAVDCIQTDLWVRYSLAVKPQNDKITLRVRQRDTVGSVFYLDAITVREVNEGVAQTLTPK